MSCLPHIVVAALTIASALGQGVSLTDFGYQAMRVNGALPSGTRPLLIVRTDVQGDDNTTHPMSFYEDLVFNFFAYPSVNGYLLVNSNGRFTLSRAGVGVVDLIGNVNFTDTERATLLTNEIAKAGHSINAAARGGFDFAAHDTNGDGFITSDELLVLVVENHNFGDDGAARTADPTGAGGPFLIEGTDKRFAGSICLVSQNVSFATLAHEISHVLNTVDVYGDAALSARFTLMSATRTSANDRFTYHFDPWHKLQLGWCEPRVREMFYGGVVTLPGSTSAAPDKPVILYDSGRGTAEFFILEYRTAVAGSYDDHVRDTGLVIWHVEQDAAHNLLKRYSNAVPPAPNEYFTMWAETSPGLAQGGRGQPVIEAWHSGATTPLLKWNDGTFSTTTIHVRPFTAGASSITVEILTARETWVDFAYTPPPAEDGTFSSPYNTLSEGVGFAPWKGTVFFKPGSTTERLHLAKPLTLRAPFGPVTLGQ